MRALVAGLLLVLVALAAQTARAEEWFPPPPPPPPPPSVVEPAPVGVPDRPAGIVPAREIAPAVVSRPSAHVVPAVLQKKSSVEFSGLMHFWWTIYEETENGKKQPWTGDDGSQETSGFSFRRVRVAADFKTGRVRGRVELGLVGTARLLDVWAAVPVFGRRLEVWAGQMKVPSTHEVETGVGDLDFVTRSRFSQQVVNWSLCRSPSNPSPFFGVRTHNRDLGVAVKGRVGAFRYFLMAGNGLGANLYIGGRENKQYLFANDFGAHFQGGRLSVEVARLIRDARVRRWLRSLELGGHASRNDHPNAVFNDEKTVLDVDRWSWSADCRIDILGRVRLTGMIGSGAVDDDFDHDGKTDYEYGGWEAKAVCVLIRNRFEVGVRHDVYEEEYFQNGVVNEYATTTLGVTYTPSRHVRLQLNYMFKSLDSPTDPDLDDDLLVLLAQLSF